MTEPVSVMPASLASTVAIRPISSIVTAFFLSTGAATATLAAGATDSIQVDLKLKGGTPVERAAAGDAARRPRPC